MFTFVNEVFPLASQNVVEAVAVRHELGQRVQDDQGYAYTLESRKFEAKFSNS